MSRRLLAMGAVCALLITAFAPAALAAQPKLPDYLKDRFEQLDVSGAKLNMDLLGPDRFEAITRDGKVDVIVQLAGKPLAARIAEARAQGRELTRAQRARIVNDLKTAQAPVIRQAKGLNARVGFTYQASYNGFSARIARSQLAKLSGLRGVTAVHPVRKVELDNERSVPYIGAPSVWADLGLTGSGIKVAIIDTGIDYTHAAFGGTESSTFPTAKVAGGWDFVGDDFTGSATPPEPDPDPMDCHGHGTHVAGTAAAFGVLDDGSTFTGPWNAETIDANSWTIGPGVAPEATLYGYRVFGCDGSSTTAIIVAAIERAVTDGVHVMNMSLGSVFGLPDEPDSVASDNAAAAGVMVVTSSGNSGPGAYITGAPGVATRALSVAAMDGGFATFPSAEIDLAGVGTMANNNASDELPVTAEIMVLPDQGLHGPGQDGISLGCDESEYAGVEGKIVVTVRGVCARVDRAIFGQQNGALAVVMINNATTLPPFEGDIPGVTIPFLGAVGTAAVRSAFLGADGDEHTITDGDPLPSASYGNLASFTSGGPRNGDSAAKPDITAPGVSTVSAAVGTFTEGTALSGTSMAAPHAAGVAALVKQANPGWSPERIKAAMMNTATTSTSLLTNSNVRLAGAGLVQPRRAVDTTLLATTGPGQASISFGAPALSGPYSDRQTITFWNTGTSAVRLDLASSFQSTAGVPASLTFNRDSIRIPAGGRASVQARLSLSAAAVRDLPDALDSSFGSLVTIRGAITATPSASGPGLYPLRIPFLLAPRGLSNVQPSRNSLNFGSTDTEGSLTVSNHRRAAHSGNAELYAWGLSSPRDASLGYADIRAAGVLSLPIGGGETINLFAVNMHQQWRNPSPMFIDIYIDTDGDLVPDYVVFGFDLILLTGTWTGQYVSYLATYPDFGLIAAFAAEAPMNSSTAVFLQGLGSWMGLGASASSFNYLVITEDLISGALDFTGWASWDVLDQPVSSGDFASLNPGQSTTFGLGIDRNALANHPQLGWMIVTLDDASGAPQADLVNLRLAP